MSEKIIVDKSIIGHWRVTLNNPPINVVDDEMYDAFYDLVGEIEAAPEPSTWAMMLLGFAGLGFAGYRKTRTWAGLRA